MVYNSRPDSIIDCISASGKERTFASVVIKFALNQINVKTKPTIFLLDEVMGKLDLNGSVDEFIEILQTIKQSMKKILIVGAGKVSLERISEIIEIAGYKESEVLLSDEIEDLIPPLAKMETLEARQLLELDKIETIAYLPSCDYDNNIQKQLSQQGWKKRPKHRR